MRWVVVVAGPSIALVGACLFPDLSQLSDAGPAGDACASCGDATLDAPADAPADVRPDGTVSYCAALTPTPRLCEDFDTGGYAAQFTAAHTSVDGLLGSDGTAFTSPPNSLFAKVGTKASTGEQAYLTRDFIGTTTQLSYAFDLRLDAWGSGESGVVAGTTIDFGTPKGHRLVLFMKNGQATLEESFEKDGGTVVTNDHTLSVSPTLGAWARVVLSVDLIAKTCTATIDGKPAVTASAMDPSWTSGTPSIELGFSYIGSNTSVWTARFDNVVVDWK